MVRTGQIFLSSSSLSTRARFERQLVLSHDTVWCWRGRAPTLPPEALPLWEPTYVLRTIVPRLRDAGVGEAKIQAMLVDNPRRYFTEAGTAVC